MNMIQVNWIMNSKLFLLICRSLASKSQRMRQILAKLSDQEVAHPSSISTFFQWQITIILMIKAVMRAHKMVSMILTWWCITLGIQSSDFYIERILHDRRGIWILSSSVQLYISQVSIANEWDVKLNTRR